MHSYIYNIVRENTFLGKTAGDICNTGPYTECFWIMVTKLFT